MNNLFNLYIDMMIITNMENMKKKKSLNQRTNKRTHSNTLTHTHPHTPTHTPPA